MKYTYQQKKDTLLLLRDNNFNLLATSRKTGVNVRTLKEWHQRYSDDIYQLDTDKDALIRKQAELSMEVNAGLRTRAAAIFEVLLTRVEADLNNKRKRIPFKDLIIGIEKVAPYILPKFVIDPDKGVTPEERDKILEQKILTLYEERKKDLINGTESNTLAITATQSSERK